MASKRLKEDPPAATTSGEEEESDNDAVSEEEVDEEKQKEKSEDEEEDDDGDDDDDEEEEEEKSPTRKPTVHPSSSSKIVSKPQPSSGSETESGSDSDTEKSPPSPSASAFTITPIASKPIGDPPKPKKPNNNSTPISISVSSSKRAAEADLSNAKDPKKSKVSSSSTANGDDEDSKKAPGAIQRLWSEEDELAILKGMIEYESKKGSDPYADMGVFHEFMKKKLHVEVSKTQLMDKIRRMKKKYRTNFEKGGEDMVFPKPHEHKSFELSKKIWGNEANNKTEPPSNRKSKANNNNSVTLALPTQEVVLGAKKERLDNEEARDDESMEEFWARYPCLNAAFETMGETGCLGLGARFSRELMVGIGSTKVRELENKCRKVREAELEVYVKRMEFLHDLGKLLLDAMKKRA